MSQRELATTAANDLFSSIVTTIFTVLDGSLIAAKDANAKQTAIDIAKKGIVVAQASHVEFLKLANTLP